MAWSAAGAFFGRAASLQRVLSKPKTLTKTRTDTTQTQQQTTKPKQTSNHVKRKLKERTRGRKVDALLADQMLTGRLYAAISSRPGQCGRCDGYVLEGRELEFYVRKMQKKKSAKAE